MGTRGSAEDVASLLSRGTWTHDHPLMASELEAFGLPIKIGVGDQERELMELYPQPRARQSAVEYFGAPGPPPGLPPGSRAPASPKASAAVELPLKSEANLLAASTPVPPRHRRLEAMPVPPAWPSSSCGPERRERRGKGVAALDSTCRQGIACDAG